MPDPLLPGLARVACIGNMPGNAEYVNVFHVVQATGGLGWLDAAKAATIHGHFATFYESIKAVMNNAWGMSQTVITDRSNNNGAQFTTAMVKAGTLATAAMPNQAAIALTWRTGFSGRSNRGRTYLGGFTTAANDWTAGTASKVAAATITTLDNAAAALITGLDTAGFPLVVYSRLGAGAVQEINSVDTGNRWDVQRRRRVKGEAYS